MAGVGDTPSGQPLGRARRHRRGWAARRWGASSAAEAEAQPATPRERGGPHTTAVTAAHREGPRLRPPRAPSSRDSAAPRAARAASPGPRTRAELLPRSDRLAPPSLWHVACPPRQGTKACARFSSEQMRGEVKRGKRASARSPGLCVSCRGLCTFMCILGMHGGRPLGPRALLSLSSCLSWKPQLRAGSRGDRPWPLRHTRLCARHRDGSGVCTPVLPQWTLTSLGEAAAAFAPRIRTAPCDGTSGSHGDVPLLPCAVGAIVPARGRCEKAPRTGRLRPQTLVSPSPGGWTPKAKVSEEGPLPAPQTAAFPSRPHTAQEKGLWCPFPSWSPPPRPDRLPKAPPPDTSPWRPG